MFSADHELPTTPSELKAPEPSEVRVSRLASAPSVIDLKSTDEITPTPLRPEVPVNNFPNLEQIAAENDIDKLREWKKRVRSHLDIIRKLRTPNSSSDRLAVLIDRQERENTENLLRAIQGKIRSLIIRALFKPINDTKKDLLTKVIGKLKNDNLSPKTVSAVTERDSLEMSSAPTKSEEVDSKVNKELPEPALHQTSLAQTAEAPSVMLNTSESAPLVQETDPPTALQESPELEIGKDNETELVRFVYDTRSRTVLSSEPRELNIDFQHANDRGEIEFSRDIESKDDRYLGTGYVFFIPNNEGAIKTLESIRIELFDPAFLFNTFEETIFLGSIAKKTRVSLKGEVEVTAQFGTNHPTLEMIMDLEPTFQEGKSAQEISSLAVRISVIQLEADDNYSNDELPLPPTAPPPAKEDANINPTEEETLANRYRQVEVNVRNLRDQHLRGEITQEQLESAMREQLVLDENHIWWLPGWQTGTWYRHENGEWVAAVPPALAPEEERLPMIQQDDRTLQTEAAINLHSLFDQGAEGFRRHPFFHTLPEDEEMNKEDWPINKKVDELPPRITTEMISLTGNHTNLDIYVDEIVGEVRVLMNRISSKSSLEENKRIEEKIALLHELLRAIETQRERIRDQFSHIPEAFTIKKEDGFVERRKKALVVWAVQTRIGAALKARIEEIEKRYEIWMTSDTAEIDLTELEIDDETLQALTPLGYGSEELKRIIRLRERERKRKIAAKQSTREIRILNQADDLADFIEQPANERPENPDRPDKRTVDEKYKHVAPRIHAIRNNPVLKQKVIDALRKTLPEPLVKRPDAPEQSDVVPQEIIEQLHFEPAALAALEPLRFDIQRLARIAILRKRQWDGIRLTTRENQELLDTQRLLQLLSTFEATRESARKYHSPNINTAIENIREDEPLRTSVVSALQQILPD